MQNAFCTASHQQWYAVGPQLRANSRWRRAAWPLETDQELAPVLSIKAAVEDKVAAVLPDVAPFNSVLVNRYADGRAQIKWHADDESCYGVNALPFAPLYSFLLSKDFISFSLKHRGEREPPLDLFQMAHQAHQVG